MPRSPALPSQARLPTAAGPINPGAAAPADTRTPTIERERTVYVPFEDLEKVFKDGGKGVFLPYREFLDLWNELTLKREKDDKPPPADAVLARAEYTGRVEGESLILDAKITVESFKKGWVLLPLVTTNAPAIGEAETGKAVLRMKEGGADVLLPEKGSYELNLKIYAPIKRSDGRQRVSLNLPRAAVSRLSIAVPGEGLEFTLNPAAAYTTQVAEGKTQFSCFFGSGGAQEIAWGAAQAVTQMQPLVLASTKMTTRIGVASVSTQADIAYRILRSPVAELQIKLPVTQEVLGVTGAGIKEWKINSAPAAANLEQAQKTLVITLEKPVRDDFSLKLQLEKPVAALPAEVRVPEIEIVGAAQASGEVTLSSESQIDFTPKTLTAVARSQTAGSGNVFRVLRQPYVFTLDVTEARPQVEITSGLSVEVLRDSTKLEAALKVEARRVGLFDLKITLPAGLVITDVRGDDIAEWKADTTATPPVLNIKLKQQKLGGFSLVITGRQTRDLLADVTLPVLQPQDVTRHEATMEVGVHSSLEANTKALGDFQQEDVASQSSSQLLPRLGGGLETSLAFRYRDAAKPAVLSLKSRSSQTNVEVLTLVEVREQSTRHTWTLAFDIAYAAADRFILAVPKAVAADIRLVDPLVKEVNKAYAPATPPTLPDLTNYALWEVILRGEKLGSFTLSLSLEKPAPIEQGKTGKVDLLQVHVPGAFQETGQVAVVKADSLEIRKSDAETLEEIDTRELRAELQRPGVFLAYKYRSLPVKLSVELARNSFLAVPQAVVTHADLITAVATDRAQTTEALYWVRNNDLQFLVVRLPKGARIVSDVFVNRESQQPMRRESSDDLLVRLPGGATTRESIPVRFVYEMPSPAAGEKLGWWGHVTVGPPTLAEVGVLETRHRVYLPEAWHYTSVTGPLTRIATERGWGAVRRVIDPLIPAFGPNLVALERSSWGEPPAVAGDLRTLYGLQVPQQGHLETLRRLGPPAEIGLGFRGKKVSYFYNCLFFMVALLVGLWLSSAPARVKLLYIALGGIGAMLLTGLVGPANIPIATSIMLAVALVAAFWFCRAALAVFAGIFKAKPQPQPRPVAAATPPPVPAPTPPVASPLAAPAPSPEPPPASSSSSTSTTSSTPDQPQP
ncbi:hypothetical protein BGE01nite_12150 [Brevifollis gellanilyticus]|uniref:Uncharacterized protein n=1 Tax=Brevifollis gellanilyticus TaxID=748831 RepID=A0A512M5B9_9BACT|nr:hypothetical protein BGE01nite_12150 [Brevifollis gellanilyticus]